MIDSFYVRASDPGVNISIGTMPLEELNNSSGAFPTANAACLYAFKVDHVTPSLTKAYFRVATASGTMDIGVYDDAGTRLTSAGSTTVPAANNTVTLTLTTAIVLWPGRRYWLAISCSNTTASFASNSVVGGIPIVPGFAIRSLVTTSHPLPSTITIGDGSNTIAFQFGIWLAAS